MFRQAARILLLENINHIIKQPQIRKTTKKIIYEYIERFNQKKHEYITISQVVKNIQDILKIEPGYKVVTPSRTHLLQYVPKNLNQLEPRSMEDSFAVAYIPLSTDLALQDKYVNRLGRVRQGRLLEDMDFFAVWIVYKHIKNPLQKPNVPAVHMLVTALVDKIDFSAAAGPPDQDIKLSGHVSWVGKTSIEVVIRLEQKLDGKWSKITQALFVMASRDPTYSSSALVNPLKPASKEEEAILAEGVKRKKQRLLNAKKSVLKVIPDKLEQLTIHNLFIRTMAAHDKYSMSKLIRPPNTRWMDESVLSSAVFSHPENRNMYNSVFGGFIMRNAYELSYALAFLYAKHRPSLKYVSDIFFLKPISVGSLIHMKAYIVYTAKNCAQITVSAESSEKNFGEMSTTNELHFTFLFNDLIDEVVPKTYREAMMYIDGKRRFEQAVAQISQQPT